MPIDFHLSESQAGIREAAVAYAQNVLKPSREKYLAHSAHHERFQATKPAYEAGVAGGLLAGHISPALGGKSGSLIESAIMVEECYAVEPSAALTMFATGLGLSPFNLLQKQETKEFLKPFLSGTGAPLASLVFSEPGGVANWVEKGGQGLATTARKEGDEWILNGEKMWATNSAGWDFKGADVACVVCRDVTTPSRPDADPRDSILMLVVTRAELERSGPGAFQVVRHVECIGHTSVSGPHIRYTNVRVPAKNVLCTGSQAVDVVYTAFDGTAVMVGAMAVGLMRAAFDAAMAFAKTDNRRGAVPLLERQAVADLLSNVKMQTEACRALVWKAAHAMENGPGDYNARRELALAAKVYCSEACVPAVTDAIKAVGISAYDLSQPFADLLNNAIVLPIFDGGNVGMRRRNMQELMLAPAYDAWASTYGPSK